MSFNRFDVVVVPFPFTDREQAKRRPALVLSDAKTFNTPAGHSVMAMITSADNQRWPVDVVLSDLVSAGLPSPSVVRMKLFTLDHRLVLRRAGVLSEQDAQGVSQALLQVFGVSHER